MLIVLNGASSSGKTWVARALLRELGPECVCTGLDDILERVQPFGPNRPGLAQWRRAIRIVGFQLTDGRLRLFKRLHREVVDYVQAGHPVVVETALMDPRALRDAAACFAPLNGLLVGVKPPLAISEQWEAARADRPVGQARKHYAAIHSHGVYNLVLDTSTLTPDECARAILQRLQGAPPDAFWRLLA